jgi:hypothetical protein
MDHYTVVVPFEPQPEPAPEAYDLGFLPEHAVEFSDAIIGRGGQGIVTAGRYTGSDGKTRDVAVKKLADGATPREVAQFRAEFETHRRASQHCEKACTLYGCCYRGPELCLVMERYERSLYEYMDAARDPSDDRKRAKVPAVQAALMANEIALGLSQLHTQNIICADLKPGNVLMDREGRLVISDFGLAIMVDRSIMRSVSSRSRGVGVTVRYAAPEQHDSDSFGALSPKADTWALGCIIVELVTGEPVWPGKRETEIMMTVAIKKQAPPIPDGLPDELQAVLRGCFVHDQAKRSSADSVIAALRPIVVAEQRRRDDEARAAEEEAAAASPVAQGLEGLPAALQGTIDLLSKQAQPTAGAHVDHHLQVEMEKMGLSATQQAVLLRDGVESVAALQLLEQDDFRLLGIHNMPPSTGAGGTPAPAAVASPEEKAELRDLLQREGQLISEAGRATLLHLVGNLTQLCQLSLQAMQAIGLNAVDRRRLANLTLKPGTCVLKNFLALQRATRSISLPGIRMLAVQHKCTQWKDVLDLDYGVVQGFADRSDRARLGSLILTAGATEQLSEAGQRVLQQVGCTNADAVATLDSTVLVGLQLPEPDVSLLFTRGQTAELSLRGLTILGEKGKLTLDDVQQLNTADARDLGLITEDCYVIDALKAYDSTLPPSWKLPPPSGAAAWVPRGGFGGGGRATVMHVEPGLLDEMVKRGFLPSEQATLVQEGVTTLPKLAQMDAIAFDYLRINLSAAQQRAAAAQQVTAAQRDELRTLLACVPPDELSWESSEALVCFVGSVDQFCELQLHRNLEHARSLGIRVSEARALQQALFEPTVGLRAQWQKDAAVHFHQHQGLSKAGADLLACGCDEQIFSLAELAANDAMVAPLGLPAADVAAAKAAKILFTRVGPALQAGSDVVTGQGCPPNGGWGIGGAVCGNAIMHCGQHYAEFTHAAGNCIAHAQVGVVDAGYDPATAQQPLFQSAARAWMLTFNTGQLYHRAKGMPQWGGQQGQNTKNGMLGLLLDLDEGSLAVYIGGRMVGVAVPPGELVGPLCWAADVMCRSDGHAATHQGAVRVAAKPVP